MPHFIVNKNSQPNGDHEVHNASTGCAHMPKPENCISLGTHPACRGAVQEARRRYPGKRVNGCYYCARDCHTS